MTCTAHCAPAVGEVWWIDLPDTVDEHGQAEPVCADPACELLARAEVAQLGGEPLDLFPLSNGDTRP